MVASRCRPKGVKPFGLAFLTFLLVPTAIGSQELAALVARQQAVAERPRVGTFGLVQVATFNLPRPMSAAMPESLSYTLAGLDTSRAEIIDSIRERMLGEAASAPALLALPIPDRRLKGDRLPLPEPPPDQGAIESSNATVAANSQEPAAPAEFAVPQKSDRLAARFGEGAAAESAPDTPPADDQTSFELASVDSAVAAPPFLSRSPVLTAVTAPHLVEQDDEPATAGAFAAGLAVGIAFSREEADPAFLMGRLYFGGSPMGETLESVQPWQSAETPNVETLAVSVDSDVQVASLTPDPPAIARPASLPQTGETIASKGQVTGEGQHPMTPAERLRLSGSNRARQERCLASAIYFESRSEPVRGQIAVAQVVLNRAFSGYYPTTVCGVVYQNAHRYLACQFTFACDRHPDVVRDQAAWQRAMAIASGALDGKLWLPDVGKATHYHAYWVRPRWVRTMHRLDRIGVHTFYRPRNWGDGADAPSWGDAAATAEASRTL